MSVKVAKFGGSSVADAKQLCKVRDIVKADEKRCYVVTSAPGKRHSKDSKITDLLYLCHTHVQHSVPFEEVFNIITKRYLEIVEELGLSIDLLPYLLEIKERISNDASVDYIASRGEYLNGLILAELLGYDFVDPIDMIFFNSKGQFDSKRTQEAASRCLAKHPRAVIPGFYGATPDGMVKTFSRGGSDVTGSIIAQAVGAEVYENWTDVSGFLMADPRIVENPKPIEKITYQELRELSYMGATVLHEDAVFPVREAGIPINIRNTNDPKHPGTIILNDKEPNIQSGTITGIAGRKDFTIIRIHKNLMNTDVGFVRKILSILELNNIPFEHIPSGIDDVSIVISNSMMAHDGFQKILNEIEEQCKPNSIDVYSSMALIATVGRGMAYTPGISAKLFTALAKEHVNIRMIEQGSSEINIIVGVEVDDFEKAIRSIYHSFVK